MSLRPARCYSTVKRPYARQSRSKPRKGYAKGVPDSKIHRFEMGQKRPALSLRLSLDSKNPVQIRHNALEAARVAAVKALSKTVGEENFFLKILVYPHHVMRENALATGAGADRYQSGMSGAFGKPIGTAARIKSGQRILEIWIEPGKAAFGKKALKIAAVKLPTSCRITQQ
jgi:large subunit ribosomal protein L10e